MVQEPSQAFQEPTSCCMLRLITENELAKAAKIYIDGKDFGNLNEDEMIGMDLSVSRHKVIVDGEIEK